MCRVRGGESIGVGGLSERRRDPTCEVDAGVGLEGWAAARGSHHLRQDDHTIKEWKPAGKFDKIGIHFSSTKK